MNAEECLDHALAAYERAMFEGDGDAIADGQHELDRVDAAAALARGRLLHARFIDDRQPDETEGHLFERAVELFARVADRRGEAEATFWLATYHQVVRGDHDSALPLLQRAESLAREAGDALTRSYALRHLSFVEQAGGRLDAARAMLEESTALRREVGHSAAVAANLVGLAHLAAAQERHDECPALLDEATELATAAEAWRVLGWIDDARARLT